jgi:uncharacterized protein YjbJ (UPF0337 family)
MINNWSVPMNKLIITTAALSLLLVGCGDKDTPTAMKETGETTSTMEKAMESSKEAVKESATAVSEGTGEAVEAAGETAGEAADSTMESASGMKEKAGEMVEQAVETVKGMAGETTQETATDAAAKEAGSMIGK